MTDSTSDGISQSSRHGAVHEGTSPISTSLNGESRKGRRVPILHAVAPADNAILISCTDAQSNDEPIAAKSDSTSGIGLAFTA